jgi:hypothetical protein
MNAKTAAERLTNVLLASGAFHAAGGPVTGVAFGSAASAYDPDQFVGFSGLAVESVGFAEFSVDDDTLQSSEGGTAISEGVHVYVARGSKRALQALPKEVYGVACTYHNVGNVVVRPKQSSRTTNRGNLYQRKNRVACGSSCAPSGLMISGTLGALCRKNSGKSLFALSNNHVFADCNHVPVGQPILSPSAADAYPGGRSPGEVCRHSEIVELRSGNPEVVEPLREDVAIAEVVDADVVSSWQGDDANGYDTPSSIASPQSQMRVKKFGRTTGFTTGTIESRQVRLCIPYESEKFRAHVWFKDVWTVRTGDGTPFALPGDSGSLVVTEDGRLAVGLVFAVGSRDVTFIIPMDGVVKRFGGLSLVSKHGL